MIGRCIVAFALLLHGALACAAQLTARVEGGHLTVHIESAAWPDSLRKDLTSGLTNRILIRATLALGAEIVQQRAVEIAVRYDLWDERFAMTIAVDGTQADALTIESLDEVQAALRRLRIPRLFATTGVIATQAHTIAVEILLNPVDRERMEMIRKWVAGNSIAPTDIGSRNTGDLSVAIFNRIFEQYARGADIAAIWRESVTSRPFKLEELSNEGR